MLKEKRFKMLKRQVSEKKDLNKRGVQFKKDCCFCKSNLDIDYKNIELISRYISSRGKILSRRISGNCAKHQRKITREIKLARFLNLLPYSGKSS